MNVSNQWRAVACAGALAVAGSASAQDPVPGLTDLARQDAASAHNRLYQRGYVQQSGGGGGYEYWWNPSRNQCVTVRTEGNQVASVVSAPPFDCGHGGAEARPSGNAAGAVIGAAAILGIAALAHKSHHHDDQRHAMEASSEADFERGYRDGLYHQPYGVRAGTAYQQGYANGTRERDAQTGYRGYSPRDEMSVTCESVGNQRVECPMDTRGAVRVERQLSHSACQEGVSWGLSRHAVWVSNGCRAVFRRD